jgi:hypothetical protein
MSSVEAPAVAAPKRAIGPGTVLWCYFPHHEEPGRPRPGPKLRPVIVLGISRDANGQVQVDCVMGTSKTARANGMAELLLERPADLARTGLSCPTLFRFNEAGCRTRLPFTKTWFAPSLRTPNDLVSGHLDARTMGLVTKAIDEARRLRTKKFLGHENWGQAQW